jgi:hypothetical protein
MTVGVRPRRRAWIGWLSAGLATAALTACGVSPQHAWTSFAAPALASVASNDVSHAVRSVVALRAAAIRHHDATAFGSTVAPSAKTVSRSQYAVLTNLPLRRFSLRVAGPVRAGHDGRTVATVVEHYRLVGDDADVVRRGPATFVHWRGRWTWESWRPARPDLWDIETVQTAVVGRVVAIASTQEMPATQLATMARTAASQVSAIWVPRWDRRVVVALPATQADFATVGAVHGGAGNIGGLTTTMRGASGQPADVVRVYLNPAAYSAASPLTQRVILTHEVTHVAQAALPDGAPLWLVEGSADFVGYSVTTVPDTVIAQDLIGSDPPLSPPVDTAFRFTTSSASLARAYEQSWSLLQSVADRYGDASVSRLYAAVVRDGGTELDRESAATRQVLGESRNAMLANWRIWLAAHL